MRLRIEMGSGGSNQENSIFADTVTEKFDDMR